VGVRVGVASVGVRVGVAHWALEWAWHISGRGTLLKQIAQESLESACLIPVLQLLQFLGSQRSDGKTDMTRSSRS